MSSSAILPGHLVRPDEMMKYSPWGAIGGPVLDPTPAEIEAARLPVPVQSPWLVPRMVGYSNRTGDPLSRWSRPAGFPQLPFHLQRKS